MTYPDWGSILDGMRRRRSLLAALVWVTACADDRTEWERFQSDYDDLVCGQLKSCGETCDYDWDLDTFLRPECSEVDFDPAGVPACFEWIESIIENQACLSSPGFNASAPVCASFVFPQECSPDPVGGHVPR